MICVRIGCDHEMRQTSHHEKEDMLYFFWVKAVYLNECEHCGAVVKIILPNIVEKGVNLEG